MAAAAPIATTRPRRTARRAGRFVLTSIVASLATLLFATAAWAHHPEVAGSAACGGVVDFTARAWLPGMQLPDGSIDPLSRTNAEISVHWRATGTSAWTTLPQEAGWHFDAANDFQFSDSFTLPAPKPASIQLMVKAERRWANGQGGGETWIAPGSITVPGCAEPGATIGDVTCAAPNAAVELTNTGDAPVDFAVNVDGATTSHTVAGGDSESITVPVADGVPSTITITAPDMTTVTRTVGYDCPVPMPSATIADATCADGGADVTLTNDGDADAVFTITVPGADDQVVTVPAGETVVVPVDVAEDATTLVTVTAEGMDDVTRELTYDCPAPVVDEPAPVVDDEPAPVIEEPVVEEPVAAAPSETHHVERPMVVDHELTSIIWPSSPAEVVTEQPATVEAPAAEVLAAEASAAAPATAEVTPTPAPAPATAAAPAAAAAPAGQLPFTGSTTGPLAATGLALVALGAGLTTIARRRAATV